MLKVEQTVESWFRLETLWEGKEEIIRRGLPHSQLSPPWQMLLLGDGSTTRHLRLLTGEAIEVEIIEMSLVGDNRDNGPEDIEKVPPPRLRRQVWLKTASGQILAYAVSWWEASRVDEYLRNRNLPIWESLSNLHTELYRDIRGIYYGNSGALEEGFGEKGPFWGRHYFFWHRRQPITLIYEVFSPYLCRYLGKQ